MITEAVYRRALGVLASAQVGAGNQQTMPSQQSAAAGEIVREYEKHARLIAQLDGRGLTSDWN